VTEIPIVVSTNEITVGGVVDQIELQLGLGEKGDRGSRIFSGDVSPLTLPANSPFFSGYTEFKPGDVYVERSATNIAMWEWKSQPGGYTWVKTADIAVSGGGGITSLDPDLTAIADITGTTGLLRKSGVNTWLLDTNLYLTSNQTVTLSGDVTGSGSTAITTTLANSGVSAGTYNNVASEVRPFTVDAKGRLTGIGSPVSINIAQSAVTNLVSDLALKAPLASPSLTGIPTAPTAAVDTNTTQLATTAYVINQGYLKSATASSTYLALSGGTLTGKVNTAASAAGGAGFNLPHGTAPTSPTNGDVWTTTAGMYVRVNGTTVGPFGTGAVWGSITGTLSSQTDLQNALNAKQNADNDLTAIAGLAGTSGFLKKTATDTWTLDTNTYLTGNQTITLSGAVTGSGTTAITTSFSSNPTFSGTVTATTFSGSGSSLTSIPNGALINSSVTVGSTAISLGSSATTIAGLTSVTSTTFVGALTGNASTASAWLTARTLTIGSTGKSVDGSAGVSWSLTEIGASPTAGSTSITTLGTIGTGTWQGSVIGAAYIDSAIARLASPTFTGTPAGPTASVDTNTTQLATTAYVVGQGYLKSATASSTYLPLSGGTVTGNINMNSASPSFIVSGTSGGTSVYIDAVPGQWSQVMFRNYTGYKNRWALWKDNVSESGSNAGSDLWLTRYDDNGSSLGEVFGVYRATGKITFGAVGSSAGLELGSNGPRIMVGTGTPEGSVTAPVGSEWTDTNTGIKYAKMAGTGNTGWSPQTPISQQGYVEETQVMMMMGVL
jgi:hypothetical protein